jgi:hypothetical protein
MTIASYRIQALVKLSVGMRLLYDCPLMSGDSFEADNFFRKYRGQTAVIESFPSKPIGLLDRRGRVPGLYLRDKGINVQFEGEEQVHTGLNLIHFVLLDPTTTLTDEEYEQTQRVGDLPNPLLFYTGDEVYKKGDLLQEPRTVGEVRFSDNGETIYVLTETTESKERREAERAARIEKRKAEAADDMSRISASMLSIMPSFPANEPCRGDELELISRGNIYHLYNSPEQLAFASPQSELSFWGMDGISQRVYGKEYAPTSERPLKTARAMVKDGKGDLFLAVSRATSRMFGRDEQLYSVRRLHDCFAGHREHVRELSLKIKPPEEEEMSMDKIGASFFDDD